jgi:hypothetical protein
MAVGSWQKQSVEYSGNGICGDVKLATVWLNVARRAAFAALAL